MPAPGDYDGDGKADLAVFNPNNGTWFIKGYLTGVESSRVAGGPTDLAVAADYDGDRKTDPAVWTYATSVWTIFTNPWWTIQWGRAHQMITTCPPTTTVTAKRTSRFGVMVRGGLRRALRALTSPPSGAPGAIAQCHRTMMATGKLISQSTDRGVVSGAPRAFSNGTAVTAVRGVLEKQFDSNVMPCSCQAG